MVLALIPVSEYYVQCHLEFPVQDPMDQKTAVQKIPRISRNKRKTSRPFQTASVVSCYHYSSSVLQCCDNLPSSTRCLNFLFSFPVKTESVMPMCSYLHGYFTPESWPNEMKANSSFQTLLKMCIWFAGSNLATSICYFTSGARTVGKGFTFTCVCAAANMARLCCKLKNDLNLLQQKLWQGDIHNCLYNFPNLYPCVTTKNSKIEGSFTSSGYQVRVLYTLSSQMFCHWL